MAVGIYVSYRQSEQCFAAIQLAELLVSYGLQVVIYSPQAPRAVGSVWDRSVLSAKRLPFSDLAAAFDWWIWFEHSPMQLEKSRHLVRNTLVVSWHKLLQQHEETLNRYSELIAPAAAIKMSLDQKEFSLPIHCIPWDSPGDISEGKPRPAGYYCRMPEQFDSSDLMKLAVIDHLVSDGHPVTLVRPSTSLPHNILKLLASWKATATKPFDILPFSTILDHRARMARCRWSVILDDTDNFGYACLESLSHGLPVVCYDIAPRDEYLKQWKNSILIDCNLELGYLDAPRAVAVPNENSTELHDSLWSATKSRLRTVIDQGLSGFQETQQILHERRSHFRSRWENLARDM